MAFRTLRLFLSSIDISIVIYLFICLFIWEFFDISFDDERLFWFVSFLWFLQLIIEPIKLTSQNHSILKQNNFITRIVFICLVISLMIFGVFFPSLLVIWLFVFVDNYTILLILPFPVMAMIVIFPIIIVIDNDLIFLSLVNYLSRFAVRKTPKIVSFISSILGAKYFPVRSLFVLLINAYTLVSVIAFLLKLLILLVILHDAKNLTVANIILYLLAFSVIVSGIRIFIETKLSLKANKLYRQGNELFKQETET